MANIYPIQTRSVDPYSSYNSNSVNRLTRMITRETNCLHDIYSIDVEADTTAPLTFVVVKEGTAFMSDVYIKIDADFRVDFEDRDFYLDVNPFNEVGYYYVVLDYYYVKSKPAPQASIKIFKPSQRAILDTSTRYLLLKVVHVLWNGSTFEIDPDFLDYDPEYPTHKRTYADLYCGIEDNLPTFDTTRDVSRLIYVRQLEEFYFGRSTQWEAFSSVRDSVDTHLCSVGQMAYMDSDGNILPAISTDSSSYAVCVILDSSASKGKVRLVGRCENVPVQTGITVAVGDRLFLSGTEAGKVSNTPPPLNGQYVGTCLEVTGGGTSCTMWFVPNGAIDSRIDNLEIRVIDLEGRVSVLEGRVSVLEDKVSDLAHASSVYRTTINEGDWISDSGSYYFEITYPSYITNRYNIVHCYDTSNSRLVQPMEIIAVSPSVLRIVMPVNTVSLRVVIIG